MYRFAIAAITCALTTTAILACSEDSKSEESEQGAGGASDGDSGAGGAAATGGAPSGGAASGGASTSSGGASASGGATTGDSGSSGGASPAPEGGAGDTLGSCTGVTVGQCSEYVHDSESTVPRDDQHDAAETDCTTDGGAWSETGCTATDLLGWCEREDGIRVYYYPESGNLPHVLEAACGAQQGTWHDP